MKNSFKDKLKNFFKSFTPYQIIYLVSVVVIVVLFTIFLPDEMLESTDGLGKGMATLVTTCAIIAVIANPVCELLISKQSKWNFIVSIVFVEITESVVLFAQGNYASAIITLLFWIPIDFASFINWNKHPDEKDEEVTKVKKLSWKADILIVLGIVAFGFGVGWLLKLIPGAENTFIDAFCSAVGMANAILLMLRYNEQWIAWGLYLILDAVLYIMAGSYIMLITVVAMMINTIYGLIKWLIYIKKHKKENATTINAEQGKNNSANEITNTNNEANK